MQRYAALDSVRGLAALSVFLAHVHAVFSRHYTAVDLTPLFLLWAGGEAVIFFFVLSGFVLTKSTLTSTPATYTQFLTGRLFRIGLPNLAMLAFCAIAVMASASGAKVMEGFRWPAHFDPQLFAAHALMVSDFNTMALNDVIWTLSHEMRFALVFPVFILLITRLRPAWALAIFAGLSLASAAWISVHGDSSAGFKTAYVYTTHYLLMFAMGGLLLLNAAPLSRRFMALSAKARWLCIGLALMVYGYARMVYLVPQKLGWPQLALFNTFVADVLVAGAACALILAAVNEPRLKLWLEKKPLLYLGKVSFSLYLVHIPVMKVCFHALPDAPGWVILAVATPLVVLATWAFHHAVELPAQGLGRSIVRKWRQGLVVSS